MNDTKNVTIAALCVSATILATVLILMQSSGGPALAATPAAAGEYVMLTGKITRDRELLYVVDLRAQKINAYEFDRRDNVIERKDQLDLKKAFTVSR